jgi:hypothetical protein
MNYVLKWSVNPICNPYPIYSHTPIVPYFFVVASFLAGSLGTNREAWQQIGNSPPHLIHCRLLFKFLMMYEGKVQRFNTLLEQRYYQHKEQQVNHLPATLYIWIFFYCLSDWPFRQNDIFFFLFTANLVWSKQLWHIIERLHHLTKVILVFRYHFVQGLFKTAGRALAWF